MGQTRAQDYHRFIDEAGDMTFDKRSKGERVSLIGTAGVSKCFMLGMTAVKQDLSSARERIEVFNESVESSRFFTSFPSVQKVMRKQGKFFPHAKNDPPELRYEFFKLLVSDIDFSTQVVVGRKLPSVFENQHHRSDRDFYADLMSHLLKDKESVDGLVLDVAQRASSTSQANLEHAVEMARMRSRRSQGRDLVSPVKFNVQPYDSDPLLAVVDYSLWAVQRAYEKGETRYYELVMDKIPLVFDVYD